MNTKYTVEKFDMTVELDRAAKMLEGNRGVLKRRQQVSGYVYGKLKDMVQHDLNTVDEKKVIASFPKRLFQRDDFDTALEYMVAASADAQLPFTGAYMLLNDYGLVPKDVQPQDGEAHIRVGLVAYTLGGAPPGYIIRLMLMVRDGGYAMGRLKSWRKKQVGRRR